MIIGTKRSVALHARKFAGQLLLLNIPSARHKLASSALLKVRVSTTPFAHVLLVVHAASIHTHFMVGLCMV